MTNIIKLKYKNVVRPILYPPVHGIGRHCVVPNAKILKVFLKRKFLDSILDYKKNNHFNALLKLQRINKLINFFHFTNELNTTIVNLDLNRFS